MQVKTHTGAYPRDYIELLAETLSECHDLVNVSMSEFIPKGTCYLYYRAGGFVGRVHTVGLRIYVGEEKPAALNAETRAAIDATP
jgi:hypothetical protein